MVKIVRKMDFCTALEGFYDNWNQSAFVADQEINLLACLTEIMVECEFK